MVNKLKSQISLSDSKGKSTTQNLKPFFISFLLLVMLIFIFLNIFASQKISPIYFQLINNNRQATVSFLKKINHHPQFAFFLKTNINNFDHFLENEVFSEQKIKEEKVAQLEALLKKNPKSRDVIYKLYLLNKDLGNNQPAEKYLKIAKEIDPNIK